MEELKAAKEAFVSGHHGCSVWEVSLLASILPLSMALVRGVSVALGPSTRPPPSDAPPSAMSLRGILGALSVMMPLVFSFTFPAIMPQIAAALLGATVLVSAMSQCFGGSGVLKGDLDPALNSPRPYFLSCYRSALMMCTMVAILAVDFHAFPRRFAKTEEFGTSLMDAGVGSFMFSKGVVTRVALKGRHATLKARVGRTFSSVWPIVALGVARLISVKGTAYQEHVTEYGVHWNFFFTLASVMVLQAASEHVAGGAVMKRAGIGAAAIALGYQWILHNTGLEAFVLGDGRDGLVAQNKEGLVSSIGYFALFLAGVQTGQWALRPRDRAEWMRFAREAITYSAGLWYLYSIATQFASPSRRLVNLPYIVWMAAHNVTFITAFLLLDICFRPWRDHLNHGGKAVPGGGYVEFVNDHQMLFFLVANLSTGIINLSINTLAVPDNQAVAILCGNMVAVSVAVAVLTYVLSLFSAKAKKSKRK